MWQKDGLASTSVNCSQDHSLGEITAIMQCCADEEVFFSGKSPSYDPIKYQLAILTSAMRSAIAIYRNYD